MLASKIPFYRKKNNLSQKQLAEKMFVTRQTISSWENNITAPDIISLITLSKLFAVSIDKLLIGDETMKKLHITNGEVFNAFMTSQFEETFIPFNEAMIEGKPLFPLFESEFIAERCFTHKVSLDTYLEVAKGFLAFSKNMEQYDALTLWFGQDTFCQMNLLTLLAYLEQRGYKGQIYTVIIDDETKKIVQDKTPIKLGHFITSYQALFQEGKVISCGNPYLDQGMNEYMELQNPTHPIIRYIQTHGETQDRKLMFESIWEMTKKYGLGDTQVKHLIEAHSSLRFDS